MLLGYGTFFVITTYFSNGWERPYLDAAIQTSQKNAQFVGNSVSAMEALRYFGSAKWVGERFALNARTVREKGRKYAKVEIGFACVYGAALAARLIVPANCRLVEIMLFHDTVEANIMLALGLPFDQERLAQAASNATRVASRWFLRG